MRTHSHTFINLLSVSAGVWTCQELICTHVAGRIPKLTLELVCFSMSVTSTLCFHSAHLVRCPSAAQARANYTLTSSMVSPPSAPFHSTKPHRRKSNSELSHQCPLACLPKGRILLCNIAQRFVENLLLFPVPFLILPAVGRKPL